MQKRLLGIGLWLVGLMVLASLVYLPPALGAAKTDRIQQTFDVAATVTALVQTREAIILILTRTPPVSSAGAVAAVTTAPTVAIKVQGLNVRSGPGTNYPVVGSVNAGKTLEIVGNAATCSWLQVEDGGRELGWISGGAQFVTFTTPCAAIPQAAIPTAPTPQPTPLATPLPQPVINQPTGAVGCYVLSNQLGFALTITLSRADGWSDSFDLGVNGEREYCAPPGDYQYTLKAPGALGAIGGTLTIKAGERYRLPLKLGN